MLDYKFFQLEMGCSSGKSLKVTVFDIDFGERERSPVENLGAAGNQTGDLRQFYSCLHRAKYLSKIAILLSHL